MASKYYFKKIVKMKFFTIFYRTFCFCFFEFLSFRGKFRQNEVLQFCSRFLFLRIFHIFCETFRQKEMSYALCSFKCKRNFTNFYMTFFEDKIGFLITNRQNERSASLCKQSFTNIFTILIQDYKNPS